MLTLGESLLWMERLIALALVQQSIELLLLHKKFGSDGVWSWEIMRREFPVPRFFGFVMQYPQFIGLVALQLLAALALLVFSSAFLVLFLFMSAVLISMRFRGAFNGGSDYMTLIVLSALVVARAEPGWAPAAVFYVAVQTGLSYFVAGLVKIKEPRWRSGVMLRDFILLTNYPVAGGARFFFESAGDRQIALLAWSVILWECSFPAAYLSPKLAVVFLGVGFLFHLTNVYVLGLNRFLFAWTAAYPSVLAAAGMASA